MKIWKNKDEFKECVFEWAKKLNVNIAIVYLRPMKKKWASYSTKGNLNFNAALLKLEKEIGEYVIVHELLHFRIPNHGRLWKSYMNIYLPAWEILDKKLKQISNEVEI